MEKKMFGTRRRFGLAKEGLTKAFRSIPGLVTSVSADAKEDLKQPKTFNFQAYTVEKQRMHEVETEKAMSLFLLRHERWKAGGPV